MKKDLRPRFVRIRRILEGIREGSRTGILPSARFFSQELGVSWHTIIRDLDYLRDDEGAPIAYDASKKGYYLTDQTWELAPVQSSERGHRIEDGNGGMEGTGAMDSFVATRCEGVVAEKTERTH